jgi:hypothetical protein
LFSAPAITDPNIPQKHEMHYCDTPVSYGRRQPAAKPSKLSSRQTQLSSFGGRPAATQQPPATYASGGASSWGPPGSALAAPKAATTLPQGGVGGTASSQAGGSVGSSPAAAFAAAAAGGATGGGRQANQAGIERTPARRPASKYEDAPAFSPMDYPLLRRNPYIFMPGANRLPPPSLFAEFRRCPPPPSPRLGGPPAPRPKS